MINLCEAKTGETIRVIENNTKNSLKERLLALGLTEGADIEVLRKGPKNDLTVYNIRGAMIALRNEEVENIYCVSNWR